MWCADCGTKYSNGLCPNCHEEAFIRETQSEFADHGFTEEFAQLADEQEVAAAKAVRAHQRDAQ